MLTPPVTARFSSTDKEDPKRLNEETDNELLITTPPEARTLVVDANVIPFLIETASPKNEVLLAENEEENIVDCTLRVLPNRESPPALRVDLSNTSL
jgi:hypothetical protein